MILQNLLAAAGVLLILWTAVLRILPDLAGWRSAELYAWSVATRQTWKRMAIVWRLHWRTYRELRP